MFSYLLAVYAIWMSTQIVADAQSYFSAVSGRCDEVTSYQYGTCRLTVCPSNETYVPGPSFCDVYSSLFQTTYVRCASALPCCMWGGTCRQICGLGETQLTFATDCFRCCVGSSAAGGGGSTVAPTPGSLISRLQGPCGNPTSTGPIVAPRILGGTVATSRAWPWMVRLVYSGGLQRVCAGVLVNDDTVLTVAHCVSGPISTQTQNLQVQLGDADLTRVEQGEQLVPVSNIEVNSNFRSGVRGNDFAILKLSRPVSYSETVLPACLPDATVPLSTGGNNQSAQCFVAGWGVQENGQLSTRLRAAPVRLMATSTCNAVMASVNNDVTQQLPVDMLCTDTSATLTDACLFDDGGMLACRDVLGRYTLVGLVSEYSCGSLPTLYTRVDSYSPALLTRL